MKPITREDWLKNPQPRNMVVWDEGGDGCCSYGKKKVLKVIYITAEKTFPVVTVNPDDTQVEQYEFCAEIEKPRRMTKERRLAIQMWEEIVDKCRSGEDFNLVEYKTDFCKKHGLKWLANCYFCNYFYSCEKCPLGDKCGQVYGKVVAKHDIESAEIILNALKGVKI